MLKREASGQVTHRLLEVLMSQRSRRPELVDYLQDVAPSPPADDSAELLREIEAALEELRPEDRLIRHGFLRTDHLIRQAVAPVAGSMRPRALCLQPTTVAERASGASQKVAGLI